jgi:hypothetical protein
MTGKKWFAWVVALALAVPVAATAQAGVFQVPGTDSTLKIYGFARTDISYDLNQLNGWATQVFKALPSSYADAALTAPSGDPQFAMFRALSSRIGFTSTTPSAAGAIGVTVESDFSTATGTLRIRHAYGKIGSFLLIGQTNSTFRDTAAGSGAETLDWNGNLVSNGVRKPQIRATFDLGGATLALGLENPSNNLGGANQIPDIAAMVNVPMSWGHVSLRGAIEPLKDAAKNSGMGFAAALGGHVNLSGDTLILEVMAGSGAQGYLDFLGNQPVSASAFLKDTSLVGYQCVSYSVAFTHVWTPQVRSNLILLGGFLKNDQDSAAIKTIPSSTATESKALAQNVLQAFGNVIYSVAKNADLGLEYTWQQKTDFFNNKYVISRVNAVATFQFY